MPSNMSTILKHKKKHTCCVENNQKVYPLKLQRGSSRNKFVNVIGTFIRECVELTAEKHSIRDKLELHHTNQHILSPLLMPTFELLLAINHNIDDINTMTVTRHAIEEQKAAMSSV